LHIEGRIQYATQSAEAATATKEAQERKAEEMRRNLKVGLWAAPGRPV
jgi:hypothetical protein